MSLKRLSILLALALAVGGGALWLTSPRAPQRDAEFGTPVLPGLAAELDSVSSVKLVGAGQQTLWTLNRTDGHWQVAEAGYAADAVRVRRLLVAIGDLRVVEAKTDDPARYPTLGVEDVDDAKAKSLRLELGGLREPRALLVGRANGQEVYVRLPGQRRALEARPGLDVARAPRDWLARSIVDLAAERVQAVAVERSDAPPWRAEKTARDAAHFDVPGLPKGRELASAGGADGAGSALGNLEFDEVRKAEPAPATGLHARAVVRTFDGLVVTLEGRSEGEARWLTLDAAFDAAIAARYPPPAGHAAPGAEQVRAEAERIAATCRGWQYRIPVYRYDAIFRKRDDLLRH